MGRKKIVRINICANCGEEFNPGRHKEKKTCSELCLKEYKDKTKWDRIEKSKQALKEKYGVDHPSHLPDFVKKTKETKIEKYGDSNYNNREKAKDTLIKCHGVDNSMKIKEVKEKSKKTKKKKYGDENFNNRDKAKKTSLDKYGVEHHLKDIEFIEKMKKTNKERFGEDWSVNTEKAKKNLIKTNLEKYGSEFYFSSDEYLLKNKKEKLKRIEEILKNSNLKFDINQYDVLRIKKEDGSLEYLKYNVECTKCNNTFKSRLINETPICRICYPLTSNTKLHLEFKDFLDENNIKYNQNNRDIIKPLELDFVLENENIAIELNGNYWHSEIGGGKDKDYHINKSKLCNKKGYKLIHIFEDEWNNKKEIVKSRIKHILNLSKNKIHARKCVIKEVEQKNKSKFLNENHIQGDSVDKIRYGLFYKDDLISLMTFSKERISNGNNPNDLFWELNRFCSKINFSVIGGFDKLLSHFLKNNNYKKITTYADCRWSGIDVSSTVYNNKFNFKHMSRPSYFYVKKNDYYNRMHRFTYNKHTLLEKFGGNKNNTEWELAIENGFDRIWDCGTMKFVIET